MDDHRSHSHVVGDRDLDGIHVHGNHISRVRFIGLFCVIGRCVYTYWDDPLVRRKVYGWVMFIALLALFTWSLLHRKLTESI
jgi:hypothetical protein